MELKIDDELHMLIPVLSSEEIGGLKNSILTEGCRDALVVWNGIIIDGHNRYKICQEHDIPFEIVERSFDSREEAKEWIIRNQLSRRNLNAYQYGRLALQLEETVRTRAKEQQGTRTDISATLPKSLEPIDTRLELARAAGIGERTMGKIMKIEKQAPEDVKQQAERGDISVNRAYQLVRNQERRQERVEKIQTLSKEPATDLLSIGKFPVLYADPPWQYEFCKSVDREIENQYPTMSLEDIKSLPVGDVATEDSVLFLWCPAPKVEEALAVMNAWGFTYKTNFVWVKDRIGMGMYCRMRHELLLIGTQGNIPIPEPAARSDSIIESPREMHSKKPDKVYEIIERLYPEYSRIELFARNTRMNWEVWGNEC